MTDLNYPIYRWSTRERIDALPMHALALAYHRAWRFLHGSDPQGKHVIEGLDLMIEFTRLNPGERPRRQDMHNRKERT
jgi:hypothetical protein